MTESKTKGVVKLKLISPLLLPVCSYTAAIAGIVAADTEGSRGSVLPEMVTSSLLSEPVGIGSRTDILENVGMAGLSGRTRIDLAAEGFHLGTTFQFSSVMSMITVQLVIVVKDVGHH